MTKIEKKSIKVTKEWNTETRRGHLLATERAGDVCLLKVKGKSLTVNRSDETKDVYFHKSSTSEN